MEFNIARIRLRLRRGLDLAQPVLTDRRGNTTMMVATAMPLLIGFVGLAVDTGIWSREHARLQMAADAAAMGAGRMLANAGATTANLQAAALAEAQAAVGGGLIGTLSTPIGVTVAANPLSTTVVLTSAADLNFTKVRSTAPVMLHATSIAGLTAASVFVAALSPTAANAINIENNGTVTATGRGVFSNSTDSSSIYVRNGSITGQSVRTAGGAIASANGSSIISPAASTGAAATADPYAALTPPANGACGSAPTTYNWGTWTLQPGTYCGGLTLQNGAVVTFAPGLYTLLNGDFTLTGGASIASAADHTDSAVDADHPELTSARPAVHEPSLNDDGVWRGDLMKNPVDRTLLRKLASLPAHLAFHWTRISQVSAGMERRHADSLRRNLGVSLPLPHEQAIVEGLEQTGLFVTDLAALGLPDLGVEGIVATAARVAHIVADRAAAIDDSRRVMNTSKPEDLLAHPLLYQWGLNAVLLRIAEAYLRQPVAYDGPILFHTPPDGREVATRKWHVDREDRRMIKVAIYLHDVDDAGGPFQMLGQPLDQNGRFIHKAMKTAELQTMFVGQDMLRCIRTCTGKAGTVIFADTARYYHRGKPAIRSHRSALFFSYFARPPRHPFLCSRSGLSRRQIAQLVEELHPAQQASALWRDTVPWILRYIPSSRT